MTPLAYIRSEDGCMLCRGLAPRPPPVCCLKVAGTDWCLYLVPAVRLFLHFCCIRLRLRNAIIDGLCTDDAGTYRVVP